jgi:hypothetical protein
MPSIGRASYESRARSDRLLHFWTLGAIVVMIAIVIMFPLQPANVLPSRLWDAGPCGNHGWPYAERSCSDDAAGKNRSIRLVSPDRIPKTTIYTAAARVEIPTVSLSDTLENSAVSRSSTAVEDSCVSKPMPAHAAAILPGAGAEPQVPSPNTRAQVRSRARNTTATGRSGGNAERQPVPELASVPRGYSFTGGGRAFDAVH